MIDNYSELLEKLWAYDLIILEGPKNSGKTFVSNRLRSDLGALSYTPWKNRRTDHSHNSDLQADLTQSFIWVFDALRQFSIDTPIVMDRSMITSFMPKTDNYQYVITNKELKQSRAKFYKDALEDLNGITVLIESRYSDSYELDNFKEIIDFYNIPHLHYVNAIP